MTNVVQIDKARGFTRMGNDLMDGLMAIDLPARELKVALYVAKRTLNFGQGATRITASDVSKATHMHPDVASKAISHLLRRNVIFREGGSRGSIGLCDPSSWVYVECPNQTNRSDSAQVVRIGHESKQTKTDDSLLYSKKEPLVTLPSEEITNPLPAEKADRKVPFGLAQMLADNPHGLDETLLADYLAVRKAKRAPMTARVWGSVNAKLAECLAKGIQPVRAMGLAVERGWQGFEVEWIVKNLGAQTAPMSRHHGFADRNYRDGLTEREDGSYGF